MNLLHPFKVIGNSVQRDGLAATLGKCAKAPFREAQSGLDRYRRWRLERTSDPKVIFQMIHQLNFWDSGESVSGPGSTLEYTASLRRHLPEVFRRHKIQTVFDAPCGDFNWMRLVVAETDIRYIGGDIVPELVKANEAKHGNELTQFRSFDLTIQPFPAADLWFCRDCLFHLPFADILAVLENFAKSDVPYVLLTNHQATVPLPNTDIRTGGFRPLDLFTAPFNLPSDVLYRIPEGSKDPNLRHEMCLWTRDQIKTALPGMARALQALPLRATA